MCKLCGQGGHAEVLFDAIETFSLHFTSNMMPGYFKELHKHNGFGNINAH